jgi:hypothetical protein
MLDLLQVAAMLALPVLVLGGLAWLLLYTAVRLALRHEVTRLEKRKAGRARTDARGAAAEPAQRRPRLVQPETGVHAATRPRPQPAVARPAKRVRIDREAAARRAAS